MSLVSSTVSNRGPLPEQPLVLMRCGTEPGPHTGRLCRR